MNVRLMLAALAVSGVVAAQPASAEFVDNGNFANGTTAGWTLTGDTSFDTVSHVIAFPGDRNAPVGNEIQLATNDSTTEGQLKQTFATGPGTYAISFALQSEDALTALDHFTTKIDGVTISPLSVTGGTSAFDWTTYTFQFTETGSDTDLEFDITDGPSFFDLTDISVELPEPASWALTLAGLAALVLIRRRNATAA
ncbi:MAG TPA: PEP-CTERM sorting domain-containing protein [Aliidongia sp.]|nr:PEP-CTERM sorting domain-containing protein [Aliidongia sp.]